MRKTSHLSHAGEITRLPLGSIQKTNSDEALPAHSSTSTIHCLKINLVQSEPLQALGETRNGPWSSGGMNSSLSSGNRCSTFQKDQQLKDKKRAVLSSFQWSKKCRIKISSHHGSGYRQYCRSKSNNSKSWNLKSFPLSRKKSFRKNVFRSEQGNSSSKHHCNSTSNRHKRNAALVAAVNHPHPKYHSISLSGNECPDPMAFHEGPDSMFLRVNNIS